MALIPEKIHIGISSCLLGENVRFDGGHKKNSYIVSVLTDYFTFKPFCPELEIGLGVPREPVRLVSKNNETRCVGTKNEELDVTSKLSAVAEEQIHWQVNLCGYILKKDSPSCGMERVKVYTKNMPQRNGVGIYAKRLLENFPHLPVEEEGRLEDPHLRENFIQRIYVFFRWKNMLRQPLTIAALQTFHAQHKYVFMSHDQARGLGLGALLASSDLPDLKSLATTYFEKMMVLLKAIATRNNHVNTLQHIQGYLKKELDTGDKQELSSSIESYQQGLLPLVVPITLLRHHFRRCPNDYITQSFYLNPHPGELMLLNHI